MRCEAPLFSTRDSVRCTITAKPGLRFCWHHEWLAEFVNHIDWKEIA